MFELTIAPFGGGTCSDFVIVVGYTDKDGFESCCGDGMVDGTIPPDNKLFCWGAAADML